MVEDKIAEGILDGVIQKGHKTKMTVGEDGEIRIAEEVKK